MPEMKCPVCGLELEIDEVYDGYYDSEKHEDNCTGIARSAAKNTTGQPCLYTKI